MMGGGMGKCSKIRHIVRLRQMLRRWRMRAAALSLSRKGAAAPPPSDVPAGHVVVCVGSSSRRFVVRASHLNHPVFRQLLRQAEEEYGFSARPGPLSLPCDESLFEDALRLISNNSSAPRFTNYTQLDDLTKLAQSIPTSSSSSSSSSSASCCCDVGRWLHTADALPLLHSHRF
ncbi:hypothetical protein Cni_G04045 [Canna indica]|uniref:Uncharacterized protein n=1 Tax=Canna indica TaxID=4628 RepID=A0AAQ3JTW5_9LILI|nr:hypothetical protein Cni_G04045 [Canna indica]